MYQLWGTFPQPQFSHLPTRDGTSTLRVVGDVGDGEGVQKPPSKGDRFCHPPCIWVTPRVVSQDSGIGPMGRECLLNPTLRSLGETWDLLLTCCVTLGSLLTSLCLSASCEKGGLGSSHSIGFWPEHTGSCMKSGPVCCM